MSLKEQVNLEKLPRHVSIIMDGNGRWARKKEKSGYLAMKMASKPLAKRLNQLLNWVLNI